MGVDHSCHGSDLLDQFGRKHSTDSTHNITDKEYSTDLSKEEVVLPLIVEGKVGLHNKGSGKSINGKEDAECDNCSKILFPQS